MASVSRRHESPCRVTSLPKRNESPRRPSSASKCSSSFHLSSSKRPSPQNLATKLSASSVNDSPKSKRMQPMSQNSNKKPLATENFSRAASPTMVSSRRYQSLPMHLNKWDHRAGTNLAEVPVSANLHTPGVLRRSTEADPVDAAIFTTELLSDSVGDVEPMSFLRSSVPFTATDQEARETLRNASMRKTQTGNAQTNVLEESLSAFNTAQADLSEEDMLTASSDVPLVLSPDREPTLFKLIASHVTQSSSILVQGEPEIFEITSPLSARNLFPIEANISQSFTTPDKSDPRYSRTRTIAKDSLFCERQGELVFNPEAVQSSEVWTAEEEHLGYGGWSNSHNQRASIWSKPEWSSTDLRTFKGASELEMDPLLSIKHQEIFISKRDERDSKSLCHQNWETSSIDSTCWLKAMPSKVQFEGEDRFDSLPRSSRKTIRPEYYLPLSKDTSAIEEVGLSGHIFRSTIPGRRVGRDGPVSGARGVRSPLRQDRKSQAEPVQGMHSPGKVDKLKSKELSPAPRGRRSLVSSLDASIGLMTIGRSSSPRAFGIKSFESVARRSVSRGFRRTCSPAPTRDDFFGDRGCATSSNVIQNDAFEVFATRKHGQTGKTRANMKMEGGPDSISPENVDGILSRNSVSVELDEAAALNSIEKRLSPLRDFAFDNGCHEQCRKAFFDVSLIPVDEQLADSVYIPSHQQGDRGGDSLLTLNLCENPTFGKDAVGNDERMKDSIESLIGMPEFDGNEGICSHGSLPPMIKTGLLQYVIETENGPPGSDKSTTPLGGCSKLGSLVDHTLIPEVQMNDKVVDESNKRIDTLPFDLRESNDYSNNNTNYNNKAVNMSGTSFGMKRSHLQGYFTEQLPPEKSSAGYLAPSEEFGRVIEEQMECKLKEEVECLPGEAQERQIVCSHDQSFINEDKKASEGRFARSKELLVEEHSEPGFSSKVVPLLFSEDEKRGVDATRADQHSEMSLNHVSSLSTSPSISQHWSPCNRHHLKESEFQLRDDKGKKCFQTKCISDTMPEQKHSEAVNGLMKCSNSLLENDNERKVLASQIKEMKPISMKCSRPWEGSAFHDSVTTVTGATLNSDKHFVVSRVMPESTRTDNEMHKFWALKCVQTGDKSEQCKLIVSSDENTEQVNDLKCQNPVNAVAGCSSSIVSTAQDDSMGQDGSADHITSFEKDKESQNALALQNSVTEPHRLECYGETEYARQRELIISIEENTNQVNDLNWQKPVNSVAAGSSNIVSKVQDNPVVQDGLADHINNFGKDREVQNGLALRNSVNEPHCVDCSGKTEEPPHIAEYFTGHNSVSTASVMMMGEDLSPSSEARNRISFVKLSSCGILDSKDPGNGCTSLSNVDSGKHCKSLKLVQAEDDSCGHDPRQKLWEERLDGPNLEDGQIFADKVCPNPSLKEHGLAHLGSLLMPGQVVSMDSKTALFSSPKDTDKIKLAEQTFLEREEPLHNQACERNSCCKDTTVVPRGHCHLSGGRESWRGKAPVLSIYKNPLWSEDIGLDFERTHKNLEMYHAHGRDGSLLKTQKGNLGQRSVQDLRNKYDVASGVSSPSINSILYSDGQIPDIGSFLTDLKHLANSSNSKSVLSDHVWEELRVLDGESSNGGIIMPSTLQLQSLCYDKESGPAGTGTLDSGGIGLDIQNSQQQLPPNLRVPITTAAKIGCATRANTVENCDLLPVNSVLALKQKTRIRAMAPFHSTLEEQMEQHGSLNITVGSTGLKDKLGSVLKEALEKMNARPYGDLPTYLLHLHKPIDSSIPSKKWAVDQGEQAIADCGSIVATRFHRSDVLADSTNSVRGELGKLQLQTVNHDEGRMAYQIVEGKTSFCSTDHFERSAESQNYPHGAAFIDSRLMDRQYPENGVSNEIAEQADTQPFQHQICELHGSEYKQRMIRQCFSHHDIGHSESEMCQVKITAMHEGAPFADTMIPSTDIEEAEEDVKQVTYIAQNVKQVAYVVSDTKEAQNETQAVAASSPQIHRDLVSTWVLSFFPRALKVRGSYIKEEQKQWPFSSKLQEDHLKLDRLGERVEILEAEVNKFKVENEKLQNIVKENEASLAWFAIQKAALEKQRAHDIMHIFNSLKEEENNHLQNIIRTFTDQILELQRKVQANEQQVSARKDLRIRSHLGFNSSAPKASVIGRTESLLKESTPSVSVCHSGSAGSCKTQSNSGKNWTGARTISPKSCEVKRCSGKGDVKGSQMDVTTNAPNQINRYAGRTAAKGVELHRSSNTIQRERV